MGVERSRGKKQKEDAHWVKKLSMIVEIRSFWRRAMHKKEFSFSKQVNTETGLILWSTTWASKQALSERRSQESPKSVEGKSTAAIFSPDDRRATQVPKKIHNQKSLFSLSWEKQTSYSIKMSLSFTEKKIFIFVTSSSLQTMNDFSLSEMVIIISSSALILVRINKWRRQLLALANSFSVGFWVAAPICDHNLRG